MKGERAKEFWNSIRRIIKPRRSPGSDAPGEGFYEYCPRCDANLTLQKGYSNALPYWVCLGCGELLTNPAVDSESDIFWFCDRCGEMLNLQPGFSESLDEWICLSCGYTNKIVPEEVFISTDEYQAARDNPYKGLSDSEVLSLSLYEEEGCIDDRKDIIIVRHRDTGNRYIKKLLTTYNKSVYDYLREHPVSHMPKIEALYESENALIVIEEYVEGRTVADILNDEPLQEKEAVRIVLAVCRILNELHGLPTPIIHRDIKPSNIIVSLDDEVYLLDVNVAKWYDPDRTDDTRYMGTRFFAAPEQAGYGLTASSAKSDIYAVGVLLNVMVTGCFPREEKAKEPLWGVIERCISLEADRRFTAAELMAELEKLV